MTPLLVLDAVSKHFDGVQALRNVSMGVNAGSILAIIGQNGSGKTTLINVVTGFYAASSGSVKLDGTDITGWSMSDIARLGVARTFQNLRLFDALSVLDNVLLGITGRLNFGLWDAMSLSMDRTRRNHAFVERALSTLNRVGIGGLASERVKDLSHGDRRRAEIARAIVSDPSLLVLDEPTAGLTSTEAQNLARTFEAVRSEGRAVVVVEHNLAVVSQIADKVLIMHAGEMIALGQMEQVIHEDRVRELYFGNVA